MRVGAAFILVLVPNPLSEFLRRVAGRVVFYQFNWGLTKLQIEVPIKAEHNREIFH